MEPSLYRYIWQHSSKSQIFLIILSVVSLPLVYITLELPKQIINLLEGLPVPSSLFGYELDRLTYLLLLSFTFLLGPNRYCGWRNLATIGFGRPGQHYQAHEIRQRATRYGHAGNRLAGP